MQGVAFTAAAVGGSPYLLAAAGAAVVALALHLQSVTVEYALSGVDTGDSAPPAPRANRLLNYVHSTAEKFPLDDCMSIAAAKATGADCRTVSLCIATGAATFGKNTTKNWTPTKRAFRRAEHFALLSTGRAGRFRPAPVSLCIAASAAASELNWVTGYHLRLPALCRDTMLCTCIHSVPHCRLHCTEASMLYNFFLHFHTPRTHPSSINCPITIAAAP
jgi:hypothetical protein